MREPKPPLTHSIRIAIYFALLLWMIKILEIVSGLNLQFLGIYPREMSSLLTIISAPLIHGSYEHLSSNTFPLVFLGSLLLYGYPRSRWWALALIWLLSGLGVWLLARASFHIGASGITHGMFFYLLTIGLLRRDARSIALLMIAFFMYGSMLLTIFPQEPSISYEYHFFGAMAGLLCALLFRQWDPYPERKKYRWEQQSDQEEDDPIIGDEWKDAADGDAENTPSVLIHQSLTEKDSKSP